MLAYHSDKALKKSVVNEMMMHRKADELVQGYGYWKDGKGCAVGCLVKGNNHAQYETKFGIPRALAYLEDRIFEGLAKEDAQKWPERFLNSITPGADLSMVASKFLYFILTDKNGILRHAKEETKLVINNVAALYKRRLNADEPTKTEWHADAAAAYAAYAADAADAYAAYAAYAAAYAADAADAYAAYAAYAAAYAAYAADAADAADAAAYAADAAGRKYFSRMADKLIQLLKAAK